MVETHMWWITMDILLWRRRYDVGGGPKSWRVRLVQLAAWWRVSLGRMKTGYTGPVRARQRMLTIWSGWDGICVIRIAWYAQRVVNSGGEFGLREGAALQLMKWLSRAVLRSCVESFNSRWNNSCISGSTGQLVDCGFWDSCGFYGDVVV